MNEYKGWEGTPWDATNNILLKYKPEIIKLTKLDDINPILSTEVRFYGSIYYAGLGYWKFLDKYNDLCIQFNISAFPGCCGIAILHNMHIELKLQRKGLATLFNNFAIDIATAAGFGVLICTDVANHIPVEKILAKNNWNEITTFKNPRTANEVRISMIELKKELK